MKNKEIAELFTRMGTLLELKEENIFKIKAYYKAADNLLALTEDIAELRQAGRLSEIPGVGKTLEAKISEYLDTGQMSAYEQLIEEIPLSILDLVNIPSVGPKKAKLFYDQLQIKSVPELSAALESGKLEGLPGLKEKAIENIRRGIKLFLAGQERMDIASASAVAAEFVSALKKLPEVQEVTVAGSLRRMVETIRDIDILVTSTHPQKIMDVFVRLPLVKAVNSHGETKSSILTHNNVQVDVRVVEPESFGAALVYFTGSKNFNIKLRQIAIKKEMKISEYGVFSVKGEKEKFLAGKTEEETLAALDLKYIPPELREDIGEAELFGGKPLPRLIEAQHIRGDLHTHSTWSDGRNTIEEMALAAKALGYSYLGVSDHSQKLKIARGVSVEDLKRKKKEIDLLNQKLNNFRILFGTEVEIDTHGDLDYNDAVLSEFDIVIASVHSHFDQPREQMTERLIKVCRNKHVDGIGHPTGRHIGKREACDIDFKEFYKAAADTNTFLEINASPQRLDLDSSQVYFGRSQGVKFTVNTDSHAVEHLSFMKFGLGIARRGWLEAKDVLNTLPLAQLEKALKK